MLDKLRKFPKVYWVSQTFELMERGAYYSMMPIIVVHAIYNAGLPVLLGAVLTIFMYPFQYGLPIVTGALAEKVGYKKQIVLAFTILTSAYIFLAFAFNPITMILAVMAVGIGIGTYKPLISSTVAKCTTAEDRNLAYSIYYWIVNLAAFLIPLMFALILFAQILTIESYYVIFLAGAGLVGTNVLTAIFLFEEVPRSGKVKTVGDVFKNIKIAMTDKKFVAMVFLIGGFWALYSTFLNALPLIMFGFGFLPEGFDVMLLGVFNPGTIILLGIPLAKFIEKIESMRVVLTGIMIYLVGLAIIGFSLQWQVVILGIIVASIGEFIVAPGYMAFVSKLAPQDKKSAYIGCNFISYMVGLLGGTLVFGTIVTIVATEQEMPHFFWGIVMAAGLGLLIMFIIYYWTWGQDIIERARRIREMDEGTTGKEEIPEDYKEPFLFRVFDNKMSVVVCAILIPIILITTMGMPRYDFTEPTYGEEEVPEGPKLIPVEYSDTTTGYTAENQDSEINFNIPEEKYRLTSVECRLSWTDEPSSFPLGTNEPDEFQVTIIGPTGETLAESPASTGGSVTASVELNYTVENFKDSHVGEWTIRISAGPCGDDSGLFGLIVRTNPDNGNDWTLDFSYTYDIVEK
jgi:MFS family permease